MTEKLRMSVDGKGWQPTADIETLKKRAQYLADVRLFFAERDTWEVETPILSSAAPTAPYLDSFTTDYSPIGSDSKQTQYLQTSPEFAMKRLLAAGSGSIYQIARVFRNGEQGRLHSPEFTMLEWYRIDFTLNQLMNEVEALLNKVFNYNEFERLSYQKAFKNCLALDVFNCSDDEVKQCGQNHIPSLANDFDTDRDSWLELLMSYIIEPELAKQHQAFFIYDYPASQAQLAKIKHDQQGNAVADRFELYIEGVEIANAYNELLDANELRQRFEQDNQHRKQLNKAVIPIDENLLVAMQAGLPECSGVSVGFDRLMMLVLDKKSINAVQSFELS